MLNIIENNSPLLPIRERKLSRFLFEKVESVTYQKLGQEEKIPYERGIDLTLTFFDYSEDYRAKRENILFGLTLPLLVLGPILSLQLSLSWVPDIAGLYRQHGCIFYGTWS